MTPALSGCWFVLCCQSGNTNSISLVSFACFALVLLLLICFLPAPKSLYLDLLCSSTTKTTANQPSHSSDHHGSTAQPSQLPRKSSLHRKRTWRLKLTGRTNRETDFVVSKKILTSPHHHLPKAARTGLTYLYNFILASVYVEIFSIIFM